MPTKYRVRKPIVKRTKVGFSGARAAVRSSRVRIPRPLKCPVEGRYTDGAQ